MIIIIKQPPRLPKEVRPTRVAAYCRVSTMQEIQHHSLEAQQDYYEKLIASRPHWIFVGVYTDQVSGRHNLKMRDFQRMLEDCRNRKIDLILVKSISRMGRNTVQFLQACTKLNDLGVDVYFEVEKLHINDPQAVRLLTIYASLYQNESESKSALIIWGIRVRFANGSSAFANRPCYGYCCNAEGLLEIVSEEAEIVRRIYSWHREGRSLRCISKTLADMDIKSPRGYSKWGIETIRKILNNEKYYGNVLLQKTYISNYFTGRQSVNSGELERYVIYKILDERWKYVSTLAQLGLVKQDVIDDLMNLSVRENWNREQDNNPSYPGDVWVCKKRLHGECIYIKLKIQASPAGRLLVISYHIDGM